VVDVSVELELELKGAENIKRGGPVNRTLCLISEFASTIDPSVFRIYLL